MLKRSLHRDDRGLGAVEFALVAPVLISFIVGVSQVGRLFYANADMKNAVAHGARLASVYPVPDDAAIIAAVNARLMRDGATSKATPTVVHGTDNGNPYIEVRITYSVPLDFIFFSTPPVTLTDSRRVFTQVAAALENNAGGSSTSASSTTSASSSTTSASSTTSSGDPGSTTSTSTGSSGTTSSTTSASSSGDTGSTTSSTSSGDTGSTTSSGNNGSSGNASSSGNNGSSGHAHGDCKNQC